MSIELTQEERDRALSLRPKVPLTVIEQDGLLEMLKWFRKHQEEEEEAQKRKETRWKRLPVLLGTFAAASGLITIVNWLTGFFGHKTP